VIVSDTSAVLECLAGVDTDRRLLERLASAGALHAPHLIDVEVLAALRGLVLGSRISEDRAHDARRDFASLRVIRYPIIGIADRVWALRHRMTPYDASFVALAEALRCPLVTCDGRMARSGGHDAQIELFEAGT
jgi:predicted nucleic acid-binding protein